MLRTLNCSHSPDAAQPPKWWATSAHVSNLKKAGGRAEKLVILAARVASSGDFYRWFAFFSDRKRNICAAQQRSLSVPRSRHGLAGRALRPARRCLRRLPPMPATHWMPARIVRRRAPIRAACAPWAAKGRRPPARETQMRRLTCSTAEARIKHARSSAAAAAAADVAAAVWVAVEAREATIPSTRPRPRIQSPIPPAPPPPAQRPIQPRLRRQAQPAIPRQIRRILPRRILRLPQDPRRAHPSPAHRLKQRRRKPSFVRTPWFRKCFAACNARPRFLRTTRQAP